MSLSTINNLIKSILMDFKCPICIRYMHPPIRQCPMGHSYCNNCHMRIRNCSICRHLLRNTSRSFVLEKLHDKLTFPCRFNSRGCMQTLPGPEVEPHEDNCKFGASQCPLKVINQCKWQGRSFGLVEHCKQHHPNNIFTSNMQKLTCTKFVSDEFTSSTAFYMVFLAYRQFFKCVWEVDFETGMMYWCVFKLIGEQGDTRMQFDFIIEIQDYFDLHRKLVVKGQCPLIEFDAEKRPNFMEFVLTHYDMVRTFCYEDEMTYYVKIFPRNVSILLPK